MTTLKRSWKPMTRKRLTEIRDDLIPETPHDGYTPDEVYRMASELLMLRKLVKDLGLQIKET